MSVLDPAGPPTVAGGGPGVVELARPRLLELLDRAADGLLTCVSAPAGAGKTMLTAEWAAARRSDRAIGWLSLEPGDANPASFWRRVAEAVGRAGLPVTDLVGAPTARLRNQLTDRLTARRGSIVLVLDDVTPGHGRVLAAELAGLLNRAAPVLRVVLVGRGEPRLATARYRLTGDYTELGADELAFTSAEIADLLRRAELPATPAAVQALQQATEGWATGLQLFIASLPERPTAAEVTERAVRFDGEDRWIADYLTREVLDHQPASVRELLQATSVVRRVPPRLAVELTGRADAEAILDGLLGQHAFVRCDPDGSYRYHPMLRDLLRMQLRQQAPAEPARLHRLAASWRARNGSLREALQHAAASGDWPFLARLVIEQQLFVGVLVGSQLTGVVRAARGIPEPEMWQHPDAAVVGALVALQAHDKLRAQALLDRLEVLTEGEPAADVRFAATTIRLRLAARSPAGAPETVRLADQALTVLADVCISATEVRGEVRCLLYAERALALIGLGRLGEARASLAEGLDAGAVAAPAASGARQLLLAVRAFGLALQGALTDGAAAAGALLDSMTGRGAASRAAGYCRLALAWVAMEHAEPAVAREQLAGVASHWLRQDALAQTVAGLISARVPGSPLPVDEQPVPGDEQPVPMLSALRAATLIARGTPATAEALLSRPGDRQVEERIQLARALLALGRPAEALRQVAVPAERGVASLSSLVEAHLALSQAADQTGDAVAAVRALGTALRLARRERIRRPFVDERRWLRRSLGYLVDNPDRYRWLGTGLTGLPPAGTASSPPPLTQPLSEREQEVVKKLAEMMSTEEIAGDLFLSVNTVKTHLRSIYRKLAASRRAEAVRRARELGIL